MSDMLKEEKENNADQLIKLDQELGRLNRIEKLQEAALVE